MPITGNRAGGNRHPTRLAPMKRITITFADFDESSDYAGVAQFQIEGFKHAGEVSAALFQAFVGVVASLEDPRDVLLAAARECQKFAKEPGMTGTTFVKSTHGEESDEHECTYGDGECVVCGEIEPVEEPQPVRRKKGEGRAKRVVDEDAVAGTH